MLSGEEALGPRMVQVYLWIGPEEAEAFSVLASPTSPKASFPALAMTGSSFPLPLPLSSSSSDKQPARDVTRRSIVTMDSTMMVLTRGSMLVNKRPSYKKVPGCVRPQVARVHDAPWASKSADGATCAAPNRLRGDIE